MKGPPTSIRILSYNVQCWGSQHAGAIRITLDAIQKANCDVLCLQETNAGWEAAFSELALHHRICVDDPEASGGMMIMSRYPLVAAEIVHVEQHVEQSWFPALCVCLLVNDVQVWVMSVHLHPPYDHNDRPALFGMSISAPIRKREIAFLMEWLAPRRKATDVVIVAGDFNESDEYSSQTYLREEMGFRDALEMHAGHTHWWPVKKLFWGRNRYLVLRSRLDHVWYDPAQCRCEQVEVLQGYEGNASDHLPVVAVFRLKEVHGQVPHSSQWWTTHTLGVVDIPEDSCWNF